jgi:hypothetical protein
MLKLVQATEADMARLSKVMGHLRSKGIYEDDVIRAIKSVPRHYAANRIGFGGADTTNHSRTVQIWEHFPWLQVEENCTLGGKLWENFLGFAGTGLGGAPVSDVNSTTTQTPAAVGSSTSAAQTFAWAGTLTTDVPIAIRKAANQAGLSVGSPPIIATNGSLTINYTNATAGAITPTAGEIYTLTVLRRNGFYTGGSSGAWGSFEGGSTPSSVTNLTTEFPVTYAGLANALGVIRMSSGALAHGNCALEFLGGQFGLPANAAATKPLPNALPKLFFEIRIRFNQSTTQSVFLGLATPGQTSGANTMFTSADAWVNLATIGFRINGATSTTAINAGYGTTTAWTTAASGAVPTTLTNYTKLGFKFDATKDKCLSFFQDDVVIKELALGDLVAANWPSNVALTPTLYIQSTGSGAAAVTMDPDWIACGQLLQSGV